jgi:hypothetical protein
MALNSANCVRSDPACGPAACCESIDDGMGGSVNCCQCCSGGGAID